MTDQHGESGAPEPEPGTQPIAPRLPSAPAGQQPAPGFAPPTFVSPRPGSAADGAGAPVFLRPGQPQPGGPVQFGSAPPAAPGPEGDGMGLPPEDPKIWPWWVSVLGLAAGLASVIAAGAVLAAIISVVGGRGTSISDYDYLFGLLQGSLWVLVAVGIPLLVVRWVRPEHLGLRRQHLGFSALKLTIILFGFYLLAAGYSVAMGLDRDSNELLQDTGFGDSIPKDLVLALLYPVVAPVAEELLFRSVLYRGLRDGLRTRFGRGLAVAIGALISGAIFGLAHTGGGQDAFIPVLIALGVILALAYEWSGTIYVPILLHSINNAIATGASAKPVDDWIFVVIAAGPVLSVLVGIWITRLMRRLPSNPPAALAPSAPPPAT